MVINIVKTFLAALVFLVSTAEAEVKLPNLGDSVALGSFVDGYVKPAMVMNKSPSGTVAIIYKGDLVFAKGYGFQDVEKRVPVVAEKTLFRPGSVSKLLTWVAVMQQVEKGNIDLDADVNLYLKSFQLKDSWPGSPITMRHIMTHTAGFEDGAMGYLMVQDPKGVIPLVEAMKKYEPKRVNPPGAQTSYSNYATALAGLIVENVSGLSFNSYVRKNILDVLGMDNSTFEEPLSEIFGKNMAVSYVGENAGYVAKPFELIGNFGPAGSMSATSTDMVKFAQAMLSGGEYNGRRILQQSTVDQMLSLQFSHDSRVPGMGLGFYETLVNGNLLYGHAGNTPAFHSELVIDKQNDLVFFVSFTSAGGTAVRDYFKHALYNHFFPVEKTPPEVPENFYERSGKYSGTYKYWRSNFSGVEKAITSIGADISVVASPDDTLLVTVQGATNRFVEVDKNLFKPTDPDRPGYSSLIAFQENEAGEVTGFVAEGRPFMSTRKLSAYESGGFSALLLVFSLIVFIGVLLRYCYQKSAFNALSQADKSVHKTAIFASAINVIAVLSGLVVLVAVGDQMSYKIPMLFTVWLVLPILAFAAGLFLFVKMLQVWKGGLLAGVLPRVRYSLVALSGIFMCWLYWYWNILGFQYFS